MLFFESISSHPDDGTCDLFVQLHPASVFQDIRPVREWLVSEFSAVKIFDDSFYLAAENLYESDNVDSFCADLTDFIGERFPGLEFIVCPTSSVHHISYERSDVEK